MKTKANRPFYILASLFFTLMIMILAGCKQPGPITINKFNDTRIQSLNSFLKTYYERFGIPGLAVALVSGDSVYHSALGIADNQAHPFTSNTVFLAGSISEPVLALAALKLADEGKIDLDEPVVTYLPYFKMADNSYGKITVRHLLTHTSGIQHYNMMWDAPNYKPDAPEVTTRSIASQQPDFAVPGSRVKRSPYNYDILADLISKVTGKPFEVYVKVSVLKELNMNNSSFIKPASTAMPFRTNNWLTCTTQQDTLYPYNRENGGSGGLHTSAKDMANWMYALLNQSALGDQKFVSSSLFDEAMSVQFKTNNVAAVGFGWEISNKNGQQTYVKGSRYGGFSNQVVLIPGKKIGVMVSSNISDTDLNPADLSKVIAAWLSGKPLAAPKVPVYMAMNKVLARTGSMDRAFEVFIKAKQEASPQYDVSAAVLSQFGINLLHRVHDKQKALQAFKFCVQQYPGSAYAYLNLAEGYVFAKDPQNTRKAIEMAKTLPDDSGLKASYIAYLKENLEILEEKKG